VTLVMAYLNGNHVPNLLRLRTLLTKFIGTVCSVSAGLPMGPEGPMVHIGACVASVITYAQCSEWRQRWSGQQPQQQQQQQRQQQQRQQQQQQPRKRSGRQELEQEAGLQM
jgi:hypothetical protein